MIDSGGGQPLCFSIIYAPLANGTDVRAIVTGYDFAYQRNGTPLKRTIMQDFRVAKRVNHAVISQSRIMIGKNVMVNGDLGCRFTGTSYTHGDPLVMKSDFLGLDSVLDAKLNAFFANLRQYDVDGDNRLRVRHPIESAGIPSGTTDYDHDGHPDGAFDDVTRDGYVDEFDIFLKHFDKNGDGKVVLSSALTAGTPADGMSPEFVRSGGTAIDDDLALMMDSANPDRNRNGVFGYVDTNNNGRWDPGEAFSDVDAVLQASGGGNANRDQVLGYRDGVIDYKDAYAKVRGKLAFKATQANWAAGQGAAFWDRVRGPISSVTSSPVTYNIADAALPSLTAAGFSAARTSLLSAADGVSFNQQVATQLGVAVAALPGYVENHPAGSTSPRYLRVDPDANMDGRPDNFATAYFEKSPYNSPNYSDWYYRPVYENMVFRDVQIPAGCNALFKNCTFVGVTYVLTSTTNSHPLWSEYGKMQLAGDGKPAEYAVRLIYGDQAGENSYPTMLPATALPPNQMVLMANTIPMDKADLTAAQALVTVGYSLLADPLVVGGRRVTDTKPLSNNIRFHDCMFVGSIVSDSPGIYTQARNKIQFTGGTRFTDKHPDRPDDSSMNPDPQDVPIIAKSSMMLPNYSVDIGSFNSPPTQSVRLKGAIVAGVLDARGNTSIDGALLLTFAPVLGQQPLVDLHNNPIGNPADYNTTLGYFGPSDGDDESMDPQTLPLVDGQRIVGWDTNGDGIYDVPSSQAQPAGSTPIPFYGYGKVQLKFDPNMGLPDGVALPLQFDVLADTYKEGKP